MSYSQLYIHMVWSTKYRRKQLTPSLRERLFPFIGGIVRDLRGIPVITNGPSDHLHSLLLMPRTISVAELARHLKSRSSKWANEEFRMKALDWQAEYSAFSVSPRNVAQLVSSIESQEDHHRGESFKEELVRLLDEAGVKYDERYLFDEDDDKVKS